MGMWVTLANISPITDPQCLTAVPRHSFFSPGAPAPQPTAHSLGDTDQDHSHHAQAGRAPWEGRGLPWASHDLATAHIGPASLPHGRDGRQAPCASVSLSVTCSSNDTPVWSRQGSEILGQDPGTHLPPRHPVNIPDASHLLSVPRGAVTPAAFGVWGAWSRVLNDSREAPGMRRSLG